MAFQINCLSSRPASTPLLPLPEAPLPDTPHSLSSLHGSTIRVISTTTPTPTPTPISYEPFNLKPPLSSFPPASSSPPPHLPWEEPHPSTSQCPTTSSLIPLPHHPATIPLSTPSSYDPPQPHLPDTPISLPQLFSPLRCPGPPLHSGVALPHISSPMLSNPFLSPSPLPFHTLFHALPSLSHPIPSMLPPTPIPSIHHSTSLPSTPFPLNPQPPPHSLL
ncbi:hypothetical protein AMTRI_Chr02g221830 [Amborella trichopoda]